MTTKKHKVYAGFFTTDTGTQFQAVELANGILIGWKPTNHRNWTYWSEDTTVLEFMNRFDTGHGSADMVDVDTLLPKVRQVVQDLGSHD